MRFDYDLVIIAASPLALEVAYRYARFGRIGLVLPPASPQWQWQWQRWWLSVSPPAVLDQASWQGLQARVQQGQRLYATTVLDLAGVDVMMGVGQFVWQPQCHFRIAQEALYGRSYLLLDAPLPQRPLAEVFEGTGLSIAEALGWHIWSGGGDRYRWQVWGDRPVPLEDSWFNDRLQGALEALGVEFRFETQAAAPVIAPSLTPLNLDCLKTNAKGWLHLNRYGGTSHPQIYACGGWQPGYNLPSLTAYEAETIVHNLLLRQRQPLTYRCQPWWIGLPTPLARVGWNRHQAQQQWGTAVEVHTIACLADETSWGEMVLDRKGRLLGVTLHGAEAVAASRLFGLCLQQNLPALTSLAYAGWHLP